MTVTSEASASTRSGTLIDDSLRRRVAEALTPVFDQAGQTSGAAGRPQEPPKRPARRRERSAPDERQGDANGSGNTPALLTALPDVIQRPGSNPVEALVESVLDVLFSDRVRDTLQQGRQQVVNLLVDNSLATIDDLDTQRRLRREIEGELHDILEATINTIFAGEVRRHLSVNLRQALDAALAGEIGVAIREVGEALERVFGEIVDVLQDYWLAVTRVLMRIALQALRETVTTAVADGAGANVGGAKDKLKDAGEDLREKLEEAAKRLRGNIEKAQDDLERNIKEGFKSALPGADGERQIGRRPATRPPTGRPPNGRPPSGRPPSGQPPSGGSLSRR